MGAQGVHVDLEGPLNRFHLPDPDPAVPLVEAVKASLFLLEVAPATIMVPLLGATYLAPLSSLLEPDFAIFLIGPSGGLNTTASQGSLDET